MGFYESILPVDAILRQWGVGGESRRGRDTVDYIAKNEIDRGVPVERAYADARKAVITAENAGGNKWRP